MLQSSAIEVAQCLSCVVIDEFCTVDSSAYSVEKGSDVEASIFNNLRPFLVHVCISAVDSDDDQLFHTKRQKLQWLVMLSLYIHFNT